MVIGYMRSLNPYSTGSNSNTLTAFEILRLFILCVLILILLEVTQIQRKTERETERFRLNPYSTGSNSNMLLCTVVFGAMCLNPYSTGSNSNNWTCIWHTGRRLRVLILILLEVTQIWECKSWRTFCISVLILILLEVTQILFAVLSFHKKYKTS